MAMPFVVDGLRYALEPVVSEAHKVKHKNYSGNLEYDLLIEKNPFAFLLGIIAHQNWPREKTWALPFRLKYRLKSGELDAHSIAAMSHKTLERLITKKPALHRLNANMAYWIVSAAQKVVAQYSGDAEKIWKGVSSALEVERRLLAFRGIGPKKASMAVKILVRDFGIEFTEGLQDIYLSPDAHVKRVLRRVGVLPTHSDPNVYKSDFIMVGILLCREFPGKFDDALWFVGNRFCFENDPDCNNCPLMGGCLHARRRA